MYKLTHSLSGLQPLACSSDALYCASGLQIVRLNHDLGRPTLVATLPAARPILERSGSRLLARMFRLGAQTACLAGTDLFIARRSSIWRVDTLSGKVTLDFVIPEGRRALKLVVIEGREGEETVCFGEYFGNLARAPVSIWQRMAGKWEVSFRFDAGVIEHVHAICPTPGGRFFVLTGDFADAAAIWETDRSFSALKPVARGHQTYRACWSIMRGDTLIYATDSQLERNSVRKLPLSAPASASVIGMIEGSSIYHGVSGDHVVFSTTVEPGEPSGNLIRNVFERTRGPGIMSDDAVISMLTPDNEVVEVFRATKDGYPPRLFQFGTFMFPAGDMPEDRFFAYGVGVREFDNRLLGFRRSGRP